MFAGNRFQYFTIICIPKKELNIYITFKVKRLGTTLSEHPNFYRKVIHRQCSNYVMKVDRRRSNLTLFHNNFAYRRKI